jgi:hypothetical protein
MLRRELMAPLSTLYHALRIDEACDGLLVEPPCMKRSPTLRPLAWGSHEVTERRHDRELGLIVARFMLPRTAAVIRSTDTMIRDSDDALRAATGHYWAAAAYFDPPWRGAVLFSSDDGAVYVAADETLHAVAWGVARTALPDTDLPFQTDLTSQLHLTMVSGSLASVSNLEMLNGANLAALIRADGNAELIQFQDVALSEGLYTLTTLLRGCRGTEVFTGDHAVGDLFVLLDGDGVTRRPFGLDRLGDTLHYRAVGRGGDLRDARTEQLTLAGNDLKPYAPAQLEATESWGSNVTLSWQRRTRVGGELIDGMGEVPLAEDSEQYDLEIRFGNAVVRVVNGLTSPSYVYTSADQATDFPGFVAQGLSNPGFETGDLSGWTVESGGTWTVDNAHESLSGGQTGSWFVRSTGDGVLAQTVDVSAIARQIDLGLGQARARAWLAETASDTDAARVRLQFLDENDLELGTVDPSFTDPRPSFRSRRRARSRQGPGRSRSGCKSIRSRASVRT